jgi:hypothetical protein
MAAGGLTIGSFEIDSGNRSRVIQAPQPGRLGRGPQHETHLTLSRADHPRAPAESFCKAVGSRSPDRPRQDLGRYRQRDRVHAGPVPPLAAAAPGRAGRGGQATDSAGGGHRPTSAEGFFERGGTSSASRAKEGNAQESCQGARLNPERRPRTFEVLQDRHRSSKRLIYRLFAKYCSPQRHGGKVIDLQQARRRRCSWEIAADHIRWGHSMARHLERKEG